MLVGREHELAAIDAAFTKMLGGTGSVLFLVGEAGLGKTTLVHEWWNGARASEPLAIFVEAACSVPIGNMNIGAVEALQPWVDIVTNLERETSARQVEKAGAVVGVPRKRLDLRKLVRDSAPAWAMALPFVGDVAHAALETTRLIHEQRDTLEAEEQRLLAGEANDPHGARSHAQNQQQVFQQYVNLLGHVATDIPLVIFLDDMHWADVSSTNLLFYLSREVTERRILVVVTYRGDDALSAHEGRGHAIITVKNEILRYSAGREIVLGYLTQPDIREYLRSVFPAYVENDRFERWLQRISDGNSLFVTQFIATLRDDHLLDEHGALAGDYSAITIPASAQAVIEERMRRIDERTRTLLTYATAEGEEFTAYVLERLTNRDAFELLADLQRAIRLGVIAQRGKIALFDGGSTALFGFSHALVHKALYDSLIDAQKEFLHRRCYEMLKVEWERVSERHERNAVLAARILMHAEKCEEWDAAASIALETARGLWVAFSENEALEMIDRTMHALARATTAGSTPDARRAEAVFLRAEIDQVRGRSEAAATECDEARALFDAAGLWERGIDADVARAEALHTVGEFNRALAVATDALQRATSRGYAAGAARATNGIAFVHMLRGEFDAALEHASAGLAQYEAIGDKAGEAQAITNIGLVHSFRGEYDAAAAHFERCMTLGESLGDRALVARTLSNMGNVHRARHEFDEAMRKYTMSLALKEAIGDRAGIAVTVNSMGAARNERGEFAEALALFEQCVRLCEMTGDRATLAKAHGNAGVSLRSLGQLRDARSRFDQALALCDELGAKDLAALVQCEFALLEEREAQALEGDAAREKLQAAQSRMALALGTLDDVKSGRAESYRKELDRMRSL